MSGTLIVWKAPSVDDERAAETLLAAYYENGDESAFEASPDVERFYDEIFALYPPLEELDLDDSDTPPTWASSSRRSDRIVLMDYSWSAPDALLDDIQRLADKYELMLYDPQGPDVHRPNEPPAEQYIPDLKELVRLTLIAVAAIAVAIGAWLGSILIVSWIVIAVAAFVLWGAAYTLYHYAREARERRST